jgi:hypothetical protein
MSASIVILVLYMLSFFNPTTQHILTLREVNTTRVEARTGICPEVRMKSTIKAEAVAASPYRLAWYMVV